MTSHSRAEIRRLLDAHGLHPRKALGQHFLADPNIVGKIVRAADLTSTSRVVEVGTGTGTLTRALCAAAGRVVTYEIDRNLEPILVEELAGLDAELRFADALTIDLNTDLDGGGWIMVANLPYNVGTPLLLNALRNVPSISRFVVMLQHEVVARLIAEPGDPQYGLPSVVVGLYASVRSTFRVPPQVFVPAPAVDSAVAVLERIHPDERAERALDLAGVAFGQRRKMLRSSLKSVFDHPARALEQAGIEPQRRPETLAPGEWLRLAEVPG